MAWIPPLATAPTPLTSTYAMCKRVVRVSGAVGRLRHPKVFFACGSNASGGAASLGEQSAGERCVPTATGSLLFCSSSGVAGSGVSLLYGDYVGSSVSEVVQCSRPGVGIDRPDG